MWRKSIGLGLLSAALLSLGIYPQEYFRSSWLGFLPLFYLATDPRLGLRHLVPSSLLTSLIYYALALYWLVFHKAWIYAVVLLMVVPAIPLYFSVLSLTFRRINREGVKVFASVIFWIVLQKIYLLTPIGSLVLEAPFSASLPLLQIASVTNIGILSVLFVGLNAAGAFFIHRRRVSLGLVTVLFASLLVGIYFGGKVRLKTPIAGKIPVAVIQHNLPYSGRWRLEHSLFIRAEYRRLALTAAKGNPALIVFPLYTFPEDILRTPDFFLGLARETKTHLLVPSHIPKEPGGSTFQEGYLNVAVLYSPEGKILGHRQSIRAAPFGEVPEFTRKEYRILEAPFGKLGILLCYEDVLPWVAKKAVKEGAHILIALSNPGQFKKTHMPYYHLLQDQLRAIESNRWLIRASANGYSAVIDPVGRLIHQTRLGQEQILEGKIASPSKP